ATFIVARTRAFSSKERSFRSTSCTATRFHKPGVLPFHKTDNRVRSADRATLFVRPISCTSAKSIVYRALASAGGPDGRKFAGSSITHGAVYASCGVAPAKKPGGVGRQAPVLVEPRYDGGVIANPSALRQVQISSATYWPHTKPRWTDFPKTPSPSSSAARDKARCASSVVCCAGNNLTSTP